MKNYISELQKLYSGYDAATITEMFQIAQADLVEVKRRVRDGLAKSGELRDARADFQAMRGLMARLERGAI